MAIGSDGTVAALFGKAARIYGATGELLGALTLADSQVNDVAVDGQGQRVFLTGFAQRDGDPGSSRASDRAMPVHWVLVASPDLKERLLWMVWNALNNALQPDAPSGGGPGFASPHFVRRNYASALTQGPPKP